ncbi:MAG: hypothetical protein LBE36_12235 [Flavobacteriaceae bacterium]|jgi:hypothetical protein|nr:hypothetical protein [Flavobacteriaceae bacterium]
MTIINSKEFVQNEDKYFELALNERVFIKKGNHTFFVTNADESDDYLEPDEDFHRAITIDEFKRRALLIVEKLDKKYAKR